jgi:hypothetical protein
VLFNTSGNLLNVSTAVLKIRKLLQPVMLVKSSVEHNPPMDILTNTVPELVELPYHVSASKPNV